MKRYDFYAIIALILCVLNYLYTNSVAYLAVMNSNNIHGLISAIKELIK